MSATVTDEVSLPAMFLIEPIFHENGIGEHRFALSLPRHWNNDEFFDFCQKNELLQIERDAEGNIEIMPPSGTEVENRSGEVLIELGLWNRRNGRPGYVFGSSAGFTLPNGAVRSPDAAWVENTRYEALSQQEREKFAPICPDFVIEVLSPSDSLPKTRTKMEEYIANGARLGWLIDRKNRKIYVYRPGQTSQELDNPADVSADPELSGFTLPLACVF